MIVGLLVLAIVWGVPWPQKLWPIVSPLLSLATVGLGAATLTGAEVSYAFLPLLAISLSVQAFALRRSPDTALRAAACLPLMVALAAEALLPQGTLVATADAVWVAGWLGLAALWMGVGLLLDLPGPGHRWLLPALLALVLLLVHGDGWPVITAEGAFAVQDGASKVASGWVVAAALVLACSTLVAFLWARVGGLSTALGCLVAAGFIVWPGLVGAGVAPGEGGEGVGTALHIQFVWSGLACAWGALMLARQEAVEETATARLVGLVLLAFGTVAWLLMRDGLSLDGVMWLNMGLVAASLSVAAVCMPRTLPLSVVAWATLSMGWVLMPGGLT